MSDAPATLWESIAATLCDDIRAGHFGPGDKLPTEAALSRRFGVNRHTVRHALAHLADQGLTYSRRGSGVFVAARPTAYPLGRRVRFHRNLIAAGHSPKRQILSLLTRAADTAEAGALQIAKGAAVHAIEGLNLADDLPVAIFRSVFPADRFPGLLDTLAAQTSISRALARHGVTDHLRRSTEITAELATPTQALHLRVRGGTRCCVPLRSAPTRPACRSNTGRPGSQGTGSRSRFRGTRSPTDKSDTIPIIYQIRTR